MQLGEDISACFPEPGLEEISVARWDSSPDEFYGGSLPSPTPTVLVANSCSLKHSFHHSAAIA